MATVSNTGGTVLLSLRSRATRKPCWTGPGPPGRSSISRSSEENCPRCSATLSARQPHPVRTATRTPAPAAAAARAPAQAKRSRAAVLAQPAAPAARAEDMHEHAIIGADLAGGQARIRDRVGPSRLGGSVILLLAVVASHHPRFTHGHQVHGPGRHRRRPGGHADPDGQAGRAGLGNDDHRDPATESGGGQGEAPLRRPRCCPRRRPRGTGQTAASRWLLRRQVRPCPVPWVPWPRSATLQRLYALIPPSDAARIASQGIALPVHGLVRPPLGLASRITGLAAAILIYVFILTYGVHHHRRRRGEGPGGQKCC